MHTTLSSGCKRKTPDELCENACKPPIKLRKYQNKMIAKVELADIKKLPFYKDLFRDIEIMETDRDINAFPEIKSLYQYRNCEAITNLKESRYIIDGTIGRTEDQIPQNFSSSNNEIKTFPDCPDLPVSIEHSPMELNKELFYSRKQGFKVSSQNVIDGMGVGVIATRAYMAGKKIGIYEGEIACRVVCGCGKENRFNAFTIREKGDDFEIKSLDKDTYVAWSGVTVQKSGKYPLELGRNGMTDLRFLNHSKNANVKIIYNGNRQLSWTDRENLQLTVVAIRAINVGEELLFDYDPEKPDSEIDFSISLVKPLTDENREKIYRRIQNLNDCRGKNLREKEVCLPEELDKDILKMIHQVEDLRKHHLRPPFVNEFLEQLNFSQRKILRLIFLPDEPNIYELRIHYQGFDYKRQNNELTAQKCADLKEFLLKYIFNDKNSWFEIDELKENLT